jgi:signal transduction histidine kinase/ActR/RegA family two-component response regulator/HAMP domain-containing protein
VIASDRGAESRSAESRPAPSARIWHKLAAIALTFIVPLALTTYLLIEELDVRIEFAKQELRGVEYLRPLSALLLDVSDHRAAARRAFTGDPQEVAARVAIEAAVDADFDALLAVDRRLGEALKTSPEDLAARDRAGSSPRGVADDWIRIKDSDSTGGVAASDALHNILLVRLRGLFSYVGDTSELILDPGLDTYYVMDALLLREPVIIERIGEGAAAVERVAAQGPSVGDSVPIGGAVALLKAASDDMARNLAVAFRESATSSAGDDLESALGPLLNAALGRIAALNRLMIENVSAPSGAVIDVAAHGRAVMDAVSANADLWRALLDQEQRLLEIRRDFYLNRKGVALRSVVAAVAVSLLLTLLLARRISRNVGEVAETSTRLAAGDLSQRAKVRSRDEIGAMAVSFNTMAERLQSVVETTERTVRERTRELSERTTALQLLQAVAAAANEAGSVPEALQQVLDDVCVSTGWPVGHALLPTIPAAGASPALVSAGVWHLADPARWEPFRRASEPCRFRAGEGLPGRVLAEGRPAWIVDVTEDDNFPRAAVCRALGLRAGMAFPVLMGTEVVAVLEFFATEPAAPDEVLLALMADVGNQLRRVIERARADAALQLSRDTAKSASRTKSAFLASMSHELRTPLNAIIGYSELLEEDLADLGQPAMASDVEKIRQSGKHLLGVINDILDLSKIEAGKMGLYLETFGVAALVEEVASTVRPLIERNASTLTVDVQPGVGEMKADLTKVRQILLNLTGNAAKFTQAGTVSISARREHRDGAAWIVVDVADTGIGMSEAEQALLFQPFTQVDSSTTRRFGGTGLGLSISRDFCHLMGGDIEVDSEPGRGSVFSVRLPVTVVDRTAPSAEPAPASVGQPDVLVVDDDPAVRDLLGRYLRDDGYLVAAAADGDEGLRLARKLRPSVIVLDVVMPERDGWDVLARLRADPELHDTPVIVLTVVDEKALGYALGATEYLTKPIDRERLLSLLRRCFEGRPSRSVVVVAPPVIPPPA